MNQLPRQQSQPVLRIIDVNSNRAAEGLRVVEEYLRFVRQDPWLSRQCKQVRHDLAQLIVEFGPNLVHARDSEGDVGREVTTDEEYQRSSLSDVAIASLKRVEQALRCLEEYGKLLDPNVSARFEQLRYRSYTLETSIIAAETGHDALSKTKLYSLIDGSDGLESFAARAGKLVEAGVDAIQLRDKKLDDRELMQRAQILRELTSSTPTLMIINDRPDIACLTNADGVHLGQEDISAPEARRIVGPRPLIGVSTHSLQQARQAVSDGANYIGVGPTFPSNTKAFERFPGLQLLKQVSAEIGLPAFAIGGIGLPQVSDVLEAGMRRIAVGAAIWGAPDAAASVARFQNQLTAATNSLPTGDVR